MSGDMGAITLMGVCRSGLAAPKRVRCPMRATIYDEAPSGARIPRHAAHGSDTIKMTWTDGGYEYDKRVIKPSVLTKGHAGRHFLRRRERHLQTTASVRGWCRRRFHRLHLSEEPIKRIITPTGSMPA